MKRATYLNDIADLMQQRFKEFVVAESEDQGKPLKDARMIDVPRSIELFRFYASLIMTMEEKAVVGDQNLHYIQRTPGGVVNSSIFVLEVVDSFRLL